MTGHDYNIALQALPTEEEAMIPHSPSEWYNSKTSQFFLASAAILVGFGIYFTFFTTG